MREKYKDILDKNLHETVLDKRVQETYRDCLVVLRRIKKAIKKYPLYMPKEIEEEITTLFRKLRFETIPSFVNFIETNK